MRLLLAVLSCGSLFGQSIPFPGPGMAHSAPVSGPTLHGTPTCANLGTNGGTTSGFPVTTGDAVFVVVPHAAATTATVTNSKSDTVTALTLKNGPNSSGTQIFYITNATGDAAYTLTVSGASIFASACWEVVTGLVTTSLSDGIDTGGTSGAGDSYASCTTGSVTPSAGVKWFLAGFSFEDISGPDATVNAGVTIDAQIHQNGGGYGGGIGHVLQTPNGVTINPKWSTAVNVYSACVEAAFKGM